MGDEDLRDLFAGLALTGLSSRGVYENTEPQVASWCYKIADAMIAAKYEKAENDAPEEVGIAAVVKRTRKKHGENS